ncbi:MAG: hypothetical protein H6Q48_4296 [Deltaproteobacteria bacterium]|nr:hypothetical protein [Deltaproteobacteria bacterium]
MLVPPLGGVHENPLKQDGEMEMISACKSGVTGQTNSLSFLHGLPSAHIDFAEVPINGGKPLSVIDDHSEPIDSEPVSKDHLSGV